MTIKLSDELEARLTRLARASRTTRSSVVRRAIEAYRPEDHGSPGESVLDRASDLVGSAQGGPADLLTNPDHMAGFGE